MTQPEQAVGGASDEPIIAAEPTIEDRFAALSDEPQTEEPPLTEAQAAEAAEPTPDDVPDEAEEAPPIAPPTSWKAEEQEAFKQLPPELQKTVSEREAEREKFVQSKSREAKQASENAKREAFDAVQQVNATYAQQLQQLQAMLPPVLDQYDYASDELYQRAVAQHQQVQQQISVIQQRQAHAQQQAHAMDQQATQALLQEQFPEYLDPEQGPKLRQELAAAAISLGYSEQQLANVDGHDILAMRAVANLKAKADKYDKLVSQKMETVRAAKGLPKVSRPGVATGKDAQVNQRYAADRQAMRGGDRDAAARVFGRFLD